MQKTKALFLKIFLTLFVVAGLSIFSAMNPGAIKPGTITMVVGGILMGISIGYTNGKLINMGRPIPDKNLRYNTLFVAGHLLNDEFVAMWEPSKLRMYIVEFEDSQVFYKIKEEIKRSPAVGIRLVHRPKDTSSQWCWYVARPITPENAASEALRGYQQLNIRRKDIFIDDDGKAYLLRGCRT